MEMRGSLSFVFVVLSLVSMPRLGVAQSDTSLPEQYLAIKGSLAFVGSVGVHTDAHTLEKGDDDAQIQVAALEDSSALTTPGLGAEIDYLFSAHRLLAVGGLFGMHTWHSKQADSNGEGTNFGFEVGVVIQPRLPLSSKFELYISLPITLTLSILNEYKTWTELRHFDPMTGDPQGTADDVDPNYGYGLGALLGARYAISGSFGVLTELGYQRFAFTHDVDFKISVALDKMGSGAELGVAAVTHQFRWNVGVFF
jgi:hypothetical protein